jgi:hypothetical protein
MSLSLIILALLVAGTVFWSSGRAAAERAIEHGRRACKHAGVQWLDQSVHQVRVRLGRDHEGRVRWERQFRFEYSDGGDDRHAGLITMLGSELASLVGPMPRVIDVVPN